MSVFRREEIVKLLFNKIGNGCIKVVAGVRRCGKTYLLDTLFYKFLIKKKKYNESSIKIIYLLDEHREYQKEQKLSEYLTSLVSDGKRIIVIDEVQAAENFQKTLTNFAHDYPNVDLYVTGSNSNTLSSDIIDHFKELADPIYVEPLSFEEIRKVKKAYKLDDYLKYGGIPLVINSDNKDDELDRIYSNVYQLDIKDRASKTHFNYLSTKDFDNIMDNVFSSPTPFSVTAITNKLCESFELEKKGKMLLRQDVLNFIDIVEKSFLVYPFDNDSNKERVPLDKIGVNKKYYCCDCGLAYKLCTIPSHRMTVSLETAVFLHLKKNNKNATGMLLLDEDNCTIGEIDFNYENKHIQVTYTLNDSDYEREIGNLLEVHDSDEKIVVFVNDLSTNKSPSVTYVQALEYLANSIS